MKIEIIEDDEKLRVELQKLLNNNGYKASYLTDFSDVVTTMINGDMDLILLDINLPYLNGEIICKELKQKINVPIIIITSQNTEMDELISLNYGADDFITKPFNTQILLARINRLLKSGSSEVLKYHDLTVNIMSSTMNYNDSVMELSRNELMILTYLIKHKETIVSRDELMDYLWDTNEFVDDNTLTVNINRLRLKLTNIGYKDAIKTRRGQGYILI
jgi:DNA-binding response OmpR family regulator